MPLGHGGFGGGGQEGLQYSAKLTRHDGEGGVRGKIGLHVKPILVLLSVETSSWREGVQLAGGRRGEEGVQAGQGGAAGGGQRVLLHPDYTNNYHG